jgi:hypothetical protein
MLVPIVLWIVALIFILVTLTNIIKRTIKKKRCTAVTEGTITDIKERIRSKEGVRSREYTPYITYSVDGVEYNKKFIKAYIGDTYKIGQKVEIMYNPKKPIEINKKGLSNKADILIMCIGVVIGVVGVVILLLK